MRSPWRPDSLGAARVDLSEIRVYGYERTVFQLGHGRGEPQDGGHSIFPGHIREMACCGSLFGHQRARAIKEGRPDRKGLGRDQHGAVDEVFRVLGGSCNENRTCGPSPAGGYSSLEEYIVRCPTVGMGRGLLGTLRDRPALEKHNAPSGLHGPLDILGSPEMSLDTKRVRRESQHLPRVDGLTARWGLASHASKRHAALDDKRHDVTAAIHDLFRRPPDHIDVDGVILAVQRARGVDDPTVYRIDHRHAPRAHRGLVVSNTVMVTIAHRP
ncbi:MAG: hypothetical protein PVH19_15925, partial [Planctomycetia bacterium]